MNSGHATNRFVGRTWDQFVVRDAWPKATSLATIMPTVNKMPRMASTLVYRSAFKSAHKRCRVRWCARLAKRHKPASVCVI